MLSSCGVFPGGAPPPADTEVVLVSLQWEIHIMENRKFAIVCVDVRSARMPEKTMTFRETLREARPELAKRQEKNARKRAIAIKLRALRDARGLTQVEVAESAGMTQSVIARLEALSGPLPKLETIERYVEACRGKITLLISAGQKVDGSSTKRRVEIEVDADLLAEAESLNVDFAVALEEGLRDHMRLQRTVQTLAEAADFLDCHEANKG